MLLSQRSALQVQVSIEEAAVIVFMVDVSDGVD